MAISVDDELLSFLRAPGSYSEPTTRVQHLETHISHVFLTDAFAYKLKKPVRLEFLDFSTSALRKQACDDEVRLNRRFAPGIYLVVVAVVRERCGRLRIGNDGEPIDWLVKMRRLPDDASLESLIRGGRLTSESTQRLAAHLAGLYSSAAPALVPAARYRQAVQRHIAANGQDLLRLAGDEDQRQTVGRTQAAQQRWLALFGEQLERRVCDGRIIDGHGDLRPEHIYLLARPVIIDCLEFNEELRQIDVLDELSFLAMECERLGAPAIGAHILEAYQAESRDAPLATLIDFYTSYRASVRAKVALLRADQLAGAEAASAQSLAREYFWIAARHAAALAPPLLLVVRGLSGTGKSTLAASLAQTLALQHCQTDEVRRKLFGPTHSTSYGEGLYSPQNRQRVYDALFEAVERRLADGHSVVMDGTFPSARLLESACDLAARNNAAFLVVQCDCPEFVAHHRLAQRSQTGTSLSDADYDTHRRQKLAHEPVPDTIPATTVDTTEVLPRQAQFVTKRLAEICASNRCRRTA